jgi:hypothetical protein
VTLLQQLYKLNFRLISYQPNMVTDKISGYYQYFEVVFKKERLELPRLYRHCIEHSFHADMTFTEIEQDSNLFWAFLHWSKLRSLLGSFTIDYENKT